MFSQWSKKQWIDDAQTQFQFLWQMHLPWEVHKSQSCTC